MHIIQEPLVMKTEGKREIRVLRDSPIPLSGGLKHKTPGGGWGDPQAVQALFEDMQRRMAEMEEQILEQGKTQQDQNAQMSQPLPATSGVGPIVRPSPVILPPPPTRLPVHAQIPEFTGEIVGPSGLMSIEVCLKRIDDNTVGRHWTDEHRILLARKNLSDSALTRLNNRGMYDAENWDNFKKQMKDTFTIREEMRESAWHNYQPIRKNSESVSALVDRIANDLDSFTEDGTMPEKQKLKEVKRVLVRVLPPQLHYGIGSSVDTLQKLMQKLEIRACRQPDLKLAPPDISSEKLDEVWNNPTQNSTINAVSTATTAPPAAATATASADPATVNANPHPKKQWRLLQHRIRNPRKKIMTNNLVQEIIGTGQRRKIKRRRKGGNTNNNSSKRGGATITDMELATPVGGRAIEDRSAITVDFPAIIAVIQVIWRPCIGNQKKRQHSPAPAWPVPLLPNRCDSHSRCSSVFPKCEPWQLICWDDISWTSTTTPPTTEISLLPYVDTTLANHPQASPPATAATAVKAENYITTVNSIDSKSYSFSLKIIIGICDKWLEALVDTGSTVSLIEEDIVTGNVVKINDHITLKTAGKGDGLFSSSTVKQQFFIGNKIFEHEFLVVKSLHLSPISLILGYDLISKFKFVIKAQENKQIFVDDLVIPTIASNSYTVNIIASERETNLFNK